MGWNYRVIRSHYSDSNNDNISIYAIHEVYYGDDGSPDSWTMNAITLDGFDEYGDLEGSIDLIKRAFLKPVLEVAKSDNGEEYLREVTITH